MDRTRSTHPNTQICSSQFAPDQTEGRGRLRFSGVIMLHRSFPRAHRLSHFALAILTLAALSGSPAAARAADPIATATQRAVAWLSAKRTIRWRLWHRLLGRRRCGRHGGRGCRARCRRRLRPRADIRFGRIAARLPCGESRRRRAQDRADCRLVAGLVAAGIDPRAFGGRNLIADLAAGQDPKTGIIGDNIFTHGLAMRGAARAKAPQPVGAAAALIAAQNTSGGWAFTGVGAPDVDTTRPSSL